MEAYIFLGVWSLVLGVALSAFAACVAFVHRGLGAPVWLCVFGGAMLLAAATRFAALGVSLLRVL